MSAIDKVLVTGGLGYIGSHIVLDLCSRGYNVVIIDDLSNSRLLTYSNLLNISKAEIKLYQTCISDVNTLEKIFEEHNICSVIHAAAFKNPIESIFAPLNYYVNNVEKFIRFLKVLESRNVKKIIFSSSASTYGNIECPIKEESAQMATNPYGRTKLICEQILLDLVSSKNGWKVGIARYFNPAGAHKSGLLGEWANDKAPNLFPRLCKSIYDGEKFIIYGNNYDTKDGTAIRDFIHVTDLARGHAEFMELLSQDIPGNEPMIFNFGSGHGFTVLEVVEKFQYIFGKKINYIYSNKRDNDIGISYASINRAKTELNWTPEQSLEDMCRDSYRQYAQSRGFI